MTGCSGCGIKALTLQLHHIYRRRPTYAERVLAAKSPRHACCPLQPLLQQPNPTATAIGGLQIRRNLKRLQQLRSPLLLFDDGPHLIPANINAVEVKSGHMVVRRFGPSAKQLSAALNYLAFGSLPGGGEFVVAGTLRHSDDSAVLRLDFPETAGVCEQREYPRCSAPPSITLHLGGTASQP